MIGIESPSGPVGIANVGIRTASGNVGIGRVSILTPTGDAVVFDAAASGSLTVTPSAEAVYGSRTTSTTGPATTGPVTVTPSGGTEPYSYAWSKIAGDANWTINAPSAATTSFTHSSVAADDVQDGTFRCTVTDARGRTGQADVQAFAYNFGGLS